MLFLFEAEITWNLLWLPVLWAVQFLFTMGLALLVAVVGVFFRDLQNILDFTIRIWFYLSPGLYGLEAVPQQYQTLYLSLNPFAPLLHSYKNILVYGEPPSTFMLLFAGYAVLLLFIGATIYGRKQSSIAKAL